MNIGNNIRRARLAAGVTQEELTRRLKFKRPSVVSSWETGRKEPRISNLQKIAAALGCPVADLLTNGQ